MSTKFSLKGKKALVTGASGGLGAHFARVLADAGADVALAARRRDECERHADEIISAGGRAFAVEMDVGTAASIHAAMSETVDRLGGLDILVNNAGVSTTVPLMDMTEAAWDRILDVNLKGAFLVAQAAAQTMKAHGGAIINVASILGLRVAGQVAAYATSKAGLVQLTHAMALEWARHAIRVNALCPGYVLTDINRDFFDTDAGAAIVKRIPMRRLATLDDLTGPLLLLASDAGQYMTGVALPVDGGHLVSSL